jgi:hypothetical protein
MSFTQAGSVGKASPSHSEGGSYKLPATALNLAKGTWKLPKDDAKLKNSLSSYRIEGSLEVDRKDISDPVQTLQSTAKVIIFIVLSKFLGSRSVSTMNYQYVFSVWPVLSDLWACSACAAFFIV